MNRGYVKVWRKIEDSGLIQLPNTLALFMYILLNATHKNRKVGTPTGVIELKRGQFISGRIELAARLKQTEQQIRTSLNRLVELEILTIESTNRFSVYTIENYSKYQDEVEQDNQQNSQQTTNKQPADNQQITTKQELKHLSIEEEKPMSAKKTFALPEWINKQHWDIWHSKGKRKSASAEQKQLAIEKLTRWREQGLDYAKALEDAAEGGWQGLHEPRPAARASPQKQTIHDKRTATAKAMFGDLANGNERRTIIDVSPEHYPASHRPALLENGEPVRETLD
ncbi:MAG TPA: hypothetical protein VEA39_00470 [Methylophilaceae bacterium]|nr:hypothetical protein [Methylophilaceae bacterium]